jgi:hypothetical protein
MAANRFRLLSGVLLASATTAVALLTAACSGTATVATNGSTTTVRWSAGQDTPSARDSTPPDTRASTSDSGGTRQTGGNEPANQRHLLFPNTSFTASIQSYDATTDMVSFQVVDFQPGGPDDGSFTQDPNRPGTYRLPVAGTAQITGVLALCPGIEQLMPVGVSCDKDGLVQQLEAGRQAYADVHVDATDHIDTVSERYHP